MPAAPGGGRKRRPPVPMPLGGGWRLLLHMVATSSAGQVHCWPRAVLSAASLPCPPAPPLTCRVVYGDRDVQATLRRLSQTMDLSQLLQMATGKGLPEPPAVGVGAEPRWFSGVMGGMCRARVCWCVCLQASVQAAMPSRKQLLGRRSPIPAPCASPPSHSRCWRRLGAAAGGTWRRRQGDTFLPSVVSGVLWGARGTAAGMQPLHVAAPPGLWRVVVVVKEAAALQAGGRYGQRLAHEAQPNA